MIASSWEIMMMGRGRVIDHQEIEFSSIYQLHFVKLEIRKYAKYTHTKQPEKTKVVIMITILTVVKLVKPAQICKQTAGIFH